MSFVWIQRAVIFIYTQKHAKHHLSRELEHWRWMAFIRPTNSCSDKVSTFFLAHHLFPSQGFYRLWKMNKKKTNNHIGTKNVRERRQEREGRLWEFLVIEITLSLGYVATIFSRVTTYNSRPRAQKKSSCEKSQQTMWYLRCTEWIFSWPNGI